MFNLNLGTGKRGYCDGISRRQALRLGATGLAGGLTLPRLLELQAQAALPSPPKPKRSLSFFWKAGRAQLICGT